MLSEAETISIGHIRIQNDFLSDIMPLMSGAALKVYLALKRYNPSFPSYTKIQKETGLSRQGVCDAIKELQEHKLITYQKGSTHKVSNRYEICVLTSQIIRLVVDSYLTSQKSRPVLVKKVDQSLVKKVDSNNTNIIKLNNKTKERGGKGPLAHISPIIEFENIGNDLAQDTLKLVSRNVQVNWLDLCRGKSIDWIKLEVIKACAYYFAKAQDNPTKKVGYSMAITNWLNRALDPPQWVKDKEKEDNFEADLLARLNAEVGVQHGN